MADQTVVADYLARLEAALGDEELFVSVFDSLQRDPLVQQPEAVALASRFVAPLADSTGRAKALQRILSRHANLVSFKLKRRAMGGKSAA